MKFTVLGSGSTGNAILIAANETRVLVDAGMSAREIARRLSLVGCDASQLNGVIVTHEHSDHAGGLRVLLKNLDCPVYISGKTREAYIREHSHNSSDEPRKRADALRDRTEEIESSKDFKIGAIDFHPFTIPHDAADNFGFTATHDGVCVATLMDFGHITTLITERLRGCAGIIIESNHSRDMLKACEVYPWELKQRILSRTGHLSNEDIAEWLREGFDGTARHIVLAHLSQRANNPYVAKISAEMALRERAPLFQADTEISLSFAKEPTPWIEL
ncbi:MAG TPA: MBL fold metallo-hydrolase [Pyrinomonadaceae bacterium]|jgi:phosphoribosyl 1,2-cyclic phosphodiesterase|nr:MBL fold metallo-hydrolase [Pyrinomonadaceae bacterium]